MKKVFLFLLVCVCLSTSAQTLQFGTPDSTTTTWNLSYEEFTSTHIPLEMSHPNFPNWECWLSYDGLLYVVIQRKQSWLNKQLSLKRWDAVILCLGLRD